MLKHKLRDEDAVRDGYAPSDGSSFINGAKQLLGFDSPEKDVQQGTGQIKTFNQLGFKGIIKKPDGWYLPNDIKKPAIILETKAESENLFDSRWEKELFDNIDIASTKYKNVIGILYNGSDVRVFKNKVEDLTSAKSLQRKEYYLDMYNQDQIDKEHIYKITKRINDDLHFKFAMTDLQDRMVFTACALVAQNRSPKSGLNQLKGMGFETFHNWIYNTISGIQKQTIECNMDISVLLKEFSSVRVAITNDQDAIDSFIDSVCEIAELIDSKNWNGEDVMGIFFNEFNRYKKKSDAGQVFTPENVSSLMYRLIDINMNDRVLDATCGSGSFLVKSMSNMFQEAGGYNTYKADKIKSDGICGIELYPKVYALACANMLLHKNEKAKLVLMDAKTELASKWIADNNISKVLMNPPYERKYGCISIVKNVLDSVPVGTKCAFILPDKKLEKDNGKKLLKNHTLTHIIKLPEKTFFGVGVTTSIFIFCAGIPQAEKKIRGYYIEDDGLETIKNKGRQDIKNKWLDIENYWVEAIQDDNDYKFNTRQLINPEEHLSYQMPEKPFEIHEEDLTKTMFDYLCFQKGFDVKNFKEKLTDKVLYSSKVTETEEEITIILKGDNKNV